MMDPNTIVDETPADPETVVGDFFAQLDEPEAAEEAPAPSVDPEGDEDSLDEASEDEESAEETSDEVPEASDDADDVSDEEDVHPAEARRREQQAFYDQKIAAVENQLAQMNQWAQNVYQQQLAEHQRQTQQAQIQQAPRAPQISVQQMEAGMKDDLVRTWQHVAMNQPDLVPKMISKAREVYDHETADAMQVEYNQYLTQQTQAQFQQYQEQQTQQTQQRDAPQVMRQQMGDLVQSVANQYGDAFTAVQSEFIETAKQNAPLFREYMQEQGYEMTPDAMRHFLVDTFQQVREQKLNEQSSKPRRARKQKATDHIESSTTGDRPEDMSADDFAINELLEGAKALSIDIAPTRK